MQRRLLIFVAVLALSAAACGGDSDEPAAQGAEPGGGREAGSTLRLTAQGIAFDKRTLTASAGTVSLRFDNQDAGIPHNVHVSGNGVDDKTEVDNGPTTQTLQLRLEPGAYTYVCDVHPQQMRGELSVT